MSTYKYSALDESGKKTSGFLTAHSEREARQVVKSMNLTPLNVLSVNKRFSRKSKVPQKDLLFATRQISTLLDSGVPLDETLQSISKEVENKNLSSALQSIRDEILQGKRIDIALGGFPSIFNQTYCSLIGAGDTSGNLSSAFNNLANYQEESAQIRQQVISAMTYPAILLLFSIGVIFGLLTFVMPQIVDQFVRAGATLPFLTEFLMSVAKYSPFILLMLFILSIMILLGYRKLMYDDLTAIKIHKQFLKIPILGSFFLNAEVEKFSSIMHLMMKSGLNLDLAMEQASSVISNKYIASTIKQSREDLIEGKDFILSLRKAKIFPSLFIQLLSSGYKSGNLIFMFEKVTQYMKQEIENKRSAVLSLLEPLIIILMGGVILLIVLAILIPIMEMNTISLG
jgi:general secretion pathway protein F